MRLWSIHPKHLDSKGLVAAWREGLLAKKVLEGSTKGYTKHPQLIRFRNHPSTQDAINYYLYQLLLEANTRKFNFDGSRLHKPSPKITKIQVRSGQIDYERMHFLDKLKIRDCQKYKKVSELKKVEPHPLFTIIPGNIEFWEKNNI